LISGNGDIKKILFKQIKKQKIKINGPWAVREFKRAKRINIKDAKKLLKKMQKYKVTKCKQFTKFSSMMTIVKNLIVCIKSLPYEYLESSIIMMKPWVNQITQKFRSSLERVLISDKTNGIINDINPMIQKVQEFRKLYQVKVVCCILND
jgi:bifunctional ADP-heptose synthase (sugar kinase/adenylyltransferase)